PEPERKAHKGRRNMYWKGRWQPASLWEMELLKPGNRIAGPAIIEHPATTLVVPEGKSVDVDEWNFFWLRGAKRSDVHGEGDPTPGRSARAPRRRAGGAHTRRGAAQEPRGLRILGPLPR